MNDGEGAQGPDLVILTASATPAETAAVTAVIGIVLEASAESVRLGVAERSGWERSARAIRRPLGPREGKWATFTG